MAREVFFYHHVWVWLAILLGGLTGCEQQEFVSNIEDMARDTLVYLTIECGVAMTRISSGCIIANELVATYNFCANRINWGSAIAARDGMEYHIESVVAGESMGNLAVVRVTGLGRPTLTIGDSDGVVQVSQSGEWVMQLASGATVPVYVQGGRLVADIAGGLEGSAVQLADTEVGLRAVGAL